MGVLWWEGICQVEGTASRKLQGDFDGVLQRLGTLLGKGRVVFGGI